jgi:2'-5' RNA ligase
VTPAQHNDVLAAAQERVDALEGRLARVLVPILARAGARAAHRFEQKATNHLTAAAGNENVSATATMVCLRPRFDEAEAIADPDGDPPARLHVTLAYLGQTEQPLEEIADALRPVAASLAPLTGVVGGYGLFPGVGILLPDVRGLVELRVAVTEALLEARIDYGRQHGFAAHITVHSDPSTEERDAAIERAAGKPLHFDAIHVVRGDSEEVVVPLVGVPSLTAAGEPPTWSAPFPDEVIDVDQLVADLLQKTEPVRKAMIEQTMTPALEQAGLSWDVTNPLTARVLAQSASQITSIAETTQLNVMRIIQSAYQNGLTIPQTATAIRAGMKAASATRATLIARTELAGAANGGSLAATQLVAGATGQNYSKTWRTAPGAKYPRHELYAGLDGQTVELDGTFQVGEDQLQFPGDPDGDPGEVCACRCVLTYGPPASLPTWSRGELSPSAECSATTAM